MKHKILHLLSILSIIFVSGCYKYETIDYDYESYNRLVGPQGGHIIFYNNYSDDSLMFNGVDTNNIIVELEVPEGALDSNYIFNFYTYENYNNAEELSKGLAIIGSKFFYFVPIPEAEGYHEHDQADLTYHYSMDFNKPITVKFHFKIGIDNKSDVNLTRLKYNYYNYFNANYKLFRIKIPRIDEWGADRNIFVKWNEQGYPIGYQEADLSDIILGYWYPNSYNEVQSSSIINWADVAGFQINADDNSVEFQINNSDYIYVLARITQIPLSQLPNKIKVFVEAFFDVDILRAAMNNGRYQVLLEDHSLAFFDNKGSFDFLQKFNVPYSSLPTVIKTYLRENYADVYMQGNIFTIDSDSVIWYQINMQNGETLNFDNYSGSGFQYTGKNVYTDNFDELPQSITDYITEHYPNASYRNLYYNENISYGRNYVVYIYYQNKNIKLNFNSSGVFLEAIYYGIKKEEIPEPVTSYLDSVFQGIEIQTIELYDYLDSSLYEINMLNGGMITIKPNGTLLYAQYPIEITLVPSNILNVVENKFTSSSLISADYYCIDQNLYSLYYVEDLYVEVSTTGVISIAFGTNFYDLPVNAQNYIIDNYSQEMFSNFFYDNAANDGNATYEVGLTDESYIYFDDDVNYLSGKKKNNNRRNKVMQKYQQMKRL